MNSTLKLKIAIAVIDRIVPVWQIALLNAAAGVEGVEIAVIRLRRDLRGRQRVAASARRLDRMDYLITRRLTSIADPLRQGFIENPIRTANFRKNYFDLVIDLAGNIPAARNLAPHLGVWSLVFGSHFRPSDDYPCFEEVLAGDEVTAAFLVERHNSDGPGIIREAYVAVDPHSIFVTRAQALWAAPQLVAVALRNRQAGGKEPPSRPLPKARREKSKAALSVSGSRAFGYLCAGLGHAWREFTARDEWQVHYQPGAVDNPATIDESAAGFPSVASGPSFGISDLTGFKPLPRLQNGFLADPFVARQDGKKVIFCEEYPYATRRGFIAAVEISDGVAVYPPKAVLRQPCHMSYPFLIEEGGDLYMIPETSAKGTVELYKCHHFPDDWRLAETLLSGLKAVDTTIVRMADRLWMFTAVKRGETRNFDELHLYSADRLAGPWTAHPQNPVRFDARDCRPAGALFRVGPHWIRPAQDATLRYGRRIKFQRITKISLTEYREEPSAILEPGGLGGGGWPERVEGVHTWNRAGGLAVLDTVSRVGKFRLGRFFGLK